MISVCKAITADLTKLRDLADEFYGEGNMPTDFVPEVFEKTWTNLFKAKIGVIFLLKSGEKIIGSLGAVKYPDPNSGEMIATEFFWFVNKESRGKGLKLMKAFESWVAEQGIKKMIMVHLSGSMPEKLKSLYKRMGYNEMETHFIKEIA